MEKLAIHGGMPVRSSPIPPWPRVTERAVDAVERVARSGLWSAVDGARTVEFERAFAAHHGTTRAIGMANGTVSLQIALAALGIGRGDEVIVPSYTFISTATAVLAVNAAPVFVDVRPTDATIEPAAVEAAITSRTRAVIPVHFGGHPADMDALTGICQRHGIAMVEDAAQAHGARWRGRAVGSYGDFGSFSFQNSKNLTAGEGGILTTSNDALAEKAWSLHHCGRSPSGHWYEHELLGGNYRMTEFQAALLLDQLTSMEADIDLRTRAAVRLDADLGVIEGITPLAGASNAIRHAYHLYAFRYAPEAFAGRDRGAFLEALQAEGVPASGGYVMPVHRQPLFLRRNFDVDAIGVDWRAERFDFARLELPTSKQLCDSVVWIPQPVLLSSDIGFVSEAIAKIQRNADTLTSLK